MSKPIRIVCSTCGTENVMRDAWAVWNVETQKWELGNVFDDAFCDECGEETSLKEIPVEAEGET